MGTGKSWASSPGRRRNMQANRSRDTRPELAVRSLLHARGYRYRVHFAPIMGVRRRADIVFTRLRVAVFIDGCFWHVCPEHSREVLVNNSYWAPKLARNRERDRETDALLRQHGWLTVRFWEHEESDAVADKVASLLIDRQVQVRDSRDGPSSQVGRRSAQSVMQSHSDLVLASPIDGTSSNRIRRR